MRVRLICILTLLLLTIGMTPVLAEESENTIPIRIVHTGNLLGQYTYTDTSVGFEKTATIADVEGADLLLDSGNGFAGSAFVAEDGGIQMAALFDAAGYDAVGIGVRDFENHYDNLKSLGENRNFTFIGTNIKTAEDNQDAFAPYMTKTIDRYGQNIKIGVFSLIDSAAYMLMPTENVVDLRFDSMTETARQTVNLLKNQEDCDVIIAMTSSGMTDETAFSAEELAETVPEINVILDNTNDNEEDIQVGNTLIARTGSGFSTIGQVTLQLDSQTKDVIRCEGRLFDRDTIELYKDEPTVAEMIDSDESRMDVVLNERIGETAQALENDIQQSYTGQTPLGNVVAEAYRQATGADIAFENSGAIRDGLDVGTITRREIYQILPFGTYLVVKEISGGDLKYILENSLDMALSNAQALNNGETAWPENAGGAYLQMAGVTVTFDPYATKGSRVISASVGDAPLDWDTTYTVACSQYLAESPKYPELSAQPILQSYTTCANAVEAYLSSENWQIGNSPLSTTDGVPMPEVTFSAPDIPQETMIAETVGIEITRITSAPTPTSAASNTAGDAGIFESGILNKIPTVICVLLFLCVGGMIYQNQKR